MFNRDWKKKMKKRDRQSSQVKFNAIVDENTGLTLFQREGGLYLVIKKDLNDYHVDISPSEAPVMNQYLKEPDPFESYLAEPKILKEELEPFNIALHTIFGEKKEMSLISIKVAIGSGENDYVTLNESDLLAMDVEPTISGVLEFFEKNESVIGICDRVFDHERGNVILLEAKIREPARGISSINLKIMSSLQQRGLIMKKQMKYAGLQMYTIIKAESLNQDLLDFLKQIEIDWEIIFLRRDFGIEDWLEIECEKNSINLKGFLRNKYDNLGYFDINNITRIAVVNQLNFKIVNYMAEMLDRKKEKQYEVTGSTPDKEPLQKAEIIAAAKLACAYFGVDKKIKLESGVTAEDVNYFEAELVNL